MKITHVKLSNVRNHRLSEYYFDDEVIFIGKNGAGKSSILEALYFLLCFRGFKQQPLSSLITFGEEFLRIEAGIEQYGCSHSYVLKYKDKKEVSVDEEVITDIADYLYENIVAVNTPDYMGILSQLQPDRRAFVDRFIFYTDKSYLDLIKNYNRLLSQKVLELARDDIDKIYLDILNEKIVNIASDIYNKRFKFISNINSKLKFFYKELFNEVDGNFILYESNILKHELLEKEVERKRASYGIQRDRIYMSNSESVIEKFSSFGQKKSFSLLVLLSFIQEIEAVRGNTILTMLDDFEAGLDMQRAKKLREVFSDKRQVLYTGVDSVRIDYKKVINLDN